MNHVISVCIDELPTFCSVVIDSGVGVIRYEYIRDGSTGYPHLLGAYGEHGSRTPCRDGERSAAGEARKAMNVSYARVQRWRARLGIQLPGDPRV